MAQEGYDKLMSLVDSRYRLSMLVSKRAAQIKNGIPPLLQPEETPKTRNTVSLALKELVLEKPLIWGDDLPSVEELKKTVEREKQKTEPTSYSVSFR
jgi:DNA-directed RNA polymerase subunit omega